MHQDNEHDEEPAGKQNAKKNAQKGSLGGRGLLLGSTQTSCQARILR